MELHIYINITKVMEFLCSYIIIFKNIYVNTFLKKTATKSSSSDCRQKAFQLLNC